MNIDYPAHYQGDKYQGPIKGVRLIYNLGLVNLQFFPPVVMQLKGWAKEERYIPLTVLKSQLWDLIYILNNLFIQESYRIETNDAWCSSTLRRLKEVSPLSLKVSLRSVSSLRAHAWMLFYFFYSYNLNGNYDIPNMLVGSDTRRPIPNPWPVLGSWIQNVPARDI